jgi:hypothetical protein
MPCLNHNPAFQTSHNSIFPTFHIPETTAPNYSPRPPDSELFILKKLIVLKNPLKTQESIFS